MWPKQGILEMFLMRFLIGSSIIMRPVLPKKMHWEKERAVTTLCSAWRECAVLARNWELYFTTLGSDAALCILILFHLLPWGKGEQILIFLSSGLFCTILVCLRLSLTKKHSPFAFDSFSFISVFKLHTFLLPLIVSYCFLLSANQYAEINKLICSCLL